MGEMFDLSRYLLRDPEEMDPETLRDYLASVRAQTAALDVTEPTDMESPAYESWAAAHEKLEDLEDEILDCLEALEP